jgi:hypothetical protein
MYSVEVETETAMNDRYPTEKKRKKADNIALNKQ